MEVVDADGGGDDSGSFTKFKSTSNSARQSPSSSPGTCFTVQNV